MKTKIQTKKRRKKHNGPVNGDRVNRFVVHNLNMTTKNESAYKLLMEKIFANIQTEPATIGSGPVTYNGICNGAQTMFAGTSSTQKGWIIQLTGQEAVNQFVKAAKGNSDKLLLDFKFSKLSGEVVLEIPKYENPGEIIVETLRSQSITASCNKMALNRDKTLTIGGGSASKTAVICVCPIEGSSAMALHIGYDCKETGATSKFIPILLQGQMDLEDLPAFMVREIFSNLQDCGLKKLVLGFLKETYSLPSKDKLKSSTSTPFNSKLKFVQTAFNSSVRYLDDPELKAGTLSIINTFLNDLTKKGVKIPGNLTTTSETAAQKGGEK